MSTRRTLPPTATGAGAGVGSGGGGLGPNRVATRHHLGGSRSEDDVDGDSLMEESAYLDEMS